MAELDDCKLLVGCDALTHYWPGVFPESAFIQYSGGCSFDRVCYDGFCFVYVDMDTYQSTRDAIEFFWPRMVPGGKILIDDYGWEPCAGVQKAVDEWFKPNERRVVQSQYTCVVEKK